MIELQPIALTHAGRALIGQMAIPAGAGPHPAILVMYSAYGLGDHVKNTALRLAEQGYLAVCTDMYGGGAYYPDPADAAGDYAAIMYDPDLLRARCVAWHDHVKSLPQVDPARTAAIGYCFGGKCVLELARSGADVRAVVSYHGILTTHRPAEAGTITGEVVAWCGGRDPYAPLEDIEALRAEMAAAGASWQIHTMGEAQHSFTDPDAARADRPGIAYHPLADRLSWAGTLALLDAVLHS